MSNPRTECFQMSPIDLHWVGSGNLPDALELSFSGYDHSDEWGLVISGGNPEFGVNLPTVIQTRDGFRFNYLPDLPEASTGHCLTTIDENRLLVAGGHMETVHIYDAEVSQWTPVGPLPSGGLLDQFHVTCGVVRDPADGRALKVVVAGLGPDVDQVDIYNLETGAWESGGKPNAPLVEQDYI